MAHLKLGWKRWNVSITFIVDPKNIKMDPNLIPMNVRVCPSFDRSALPFEKWVMVDSVVAH